MGMTTTQYLPIDDIDTLSPVTVEVVTTRQLREGMILVDEFDCPAGVLDHRIESANGRASWMYADLDGGGWAEATFTVSTRPTVRVAATIRRDLSE